MLNSYFQRFSQVLQDDLDQALSEVDPSKRNYKQIQAMLELLEGTLQKLNLTSSTEEWNMLSEDTKRKILELIEKDLQGVTHEV